MLSVSETESGAIVSPLFVGHPSEADKAARMMAKQETKKEQATSLVFTTPDPIKFNEAVSTVNSSPTAGATLASSISFETYNSRPEFAGHLDEDEKVARAIAKQETKKESYTPSVYRIEGSTSNNEVTFSNNWNENESNINEARNIPVGTSVQVLSPKTDTTADGVTNNGVSESATNINSDYNENDKGAVADIDYFVYTQTSPLHDVASNGEFTTKDMLYTGHLNEDEKSVHTVAEQDTKTENYSSSVTGSMGIEEIKVFTENDSDMNKAANPANIQGLSSTDKATNIDGTTTADIFEYDEVALTDQPMTSQSNGMASNNEKTAEFLRSVEFIYQNPPADVMVLPTSSNPNPIIKTENADSSNFDENKTFEQKLLEAKNKFGTYIDQQQQPELQNVSIDEFPETDNSVVEKQNIAQGFPDTNGEYFPETRTGNQHYNIHSEEVVEEVVDTLQELQVEVKSLKDLVETVSTQLLPQQDMELKTVLQRLQQVGTQGLKIESVVEQNSADPALPQGQFQPEVNSEQDNKTHKLEESTLRWPEVNSEQDNKNRRVEDSTLRSPAGVTVQTGVTVEEKHEKTQQSNMEAKREMKLESLRQKANEMLAQNSGN